MDDVINQAKLSRHSIDKYKFKVLSNANTQTNKSSHVNEIRDSSIDIHNNSQNIQEDELSVSSKDELVESLLKKTDEMTSNFIKLQMKFESKEEECIEQKQKIKQESFDEGKIAGKEEFDAKLQEDYDETQKKFIDSIVKMENSAKEYDKALDVIKQELLGAALDIAKEVVSIELDDHSSSVAKALANELIEQLQNAGKITIKVNPIDYQVILEQLGSKEKLEVIPDTAISKGGVVIMSDVGNMDAQILNRFERVKKVVLDEK